MCSLKVKHLISILYSKLIHKQSVKCFAYDVRCPWEGLQKDLEAHALQCSYYKIYDVLKEWSTEIHG